MSGGLIMTDIIVCLTFDLDAESSEIRKLEDPVKISKGQFAIRRGIPRILSLLAKHSIPATFFSVGWVAEQYPETVRSIITQDHEIAAHGYLHEEFDTLSRYEEQSILEKTNQCLEALGVQIKGFRAPYWKISSNTLKLIAKMGFLYDSSLMDDDRPYLLQIPDIPAPIVEFPVSWYLDDWPAFEIDRKPPSVVFETWKAQFDTFYDVEDIPEDLRVFSLTNHPSCIGHTYRLQVLEWLIEHMKAYDVKFARMGDVAESILARR